MPVDSEPAPAIESSYKARAVEGFLDLHFYRKVGYRLALIFSRLGMSPAQVTWAGAVLGIAAGHLYYYRDLRLNVAGMFLHVCANVFDNADGQLARLTNKGSRFGRALDGLADHLVFVSIYVHLALRYIAGGGSELVWLLALAAGLSHSVQSAVADYLRNGWLFFAEKKARAELDLSESLRHDFEALSWRKAARKKLLLRLYLNYTREQELLVPCLGELKRALMARPGAEIAEAYRAAAAPIIRWLNLLATNPRMLLLFALLLARRPTWYFVAEVSLFNLLLLEFLRRQNRLCRELMSIPS